MSNRPSSAPRKPTSAPKATMTPGSTTSRRKVTAPETFKFLAAALKSSWAPKVKRAIGVAVAPMLTMDFSRKTGSLIPVITNAAANGQGDNQRFLAMLLRIFFRLTLHPGILRREDGEDDHRAHIERATAKGSTAKALAVPLHRTCSP